MYRKCNLAKHVIIKLYTSTGNFDVQAYGTPGNKHVPGKRKLLNKMTAHEDELNLHFKHISLLNRRQDADGLKATLSSW